MNEERKFGDRQGRGEARHLICGDFEEFFDKEELRRFDDFLLTRGIPARGFLISVALEEGGKVWIRYEIGEVTQQGKKIRYKFTDVCGFVPEDSSDSSVPQDFANLPVWWITDES